jgi:stearoyl-CoA desaturase (Delta-9 desaturase)
LQHSPGQNHLAEQKNIDTEELNLPIVWRQALIIFYLHVAAIYGFTLQFQLSSFIINAVFAIASGFGLGVASHRYFTHRSFKANGKLRALLLFLQTLSAKMSVINWVRDHRTHHKYTNTNADPNNPNRGFFFSHMGWLMCKKHPDVIKYGRKIDHSDVEDDPVLQFQKK